MNKGHPGLQDGSVLFPEREKMFYVLDVFCFLVFM